MLEAIRRYVMDKQYAIEFENLYRMYLKLRVKSEQMECVVVDIKRGDD